MRGVRSLLSPRSPIPPSHLSPEEPLAGSRKLTFFHPPLPLPSPLFVFAGPAYTAAFSPHAGCVVIGDQEDRVKLLYLKPSELGGSKRIVPHRGAILVRLDLSCLLFPLSLRRSTQRIPSRDNVNADAASPPPPPPPTYSPSPPPLTIPLSSPPQSTAPASSPPVFAR